MALSFPNQSRSYDPSRNLVRFWGYDSALEIPFFVEAGALCKLKPGTKKAEAEYLEAFDALRERIHEAARKAYARTRDDAYLLSEGDF